MKQVFDEYSDAFIQIIVLGLITFVLSAVAFSGVKGILNVSGKIAEVDENISSNYNDLTELEAFSKQQPPTISCTGSAKLNQPTKYSEVFTVTGGELIIKEVIKESGEIVTDRVVNANNKTFNFTEKGIYIIKVAVFGNKYIFKEFKVVI